MKKILYALPILLCASTISAGSADFAWGAMFGCGVNAIANNMSRYHQPCKPSLYVYAKPDVYVVPQPVAQPIQPQVVCYPRPQTVSHTTETHIIKDQSNCKECEFESNQVQLQILKEQNRKKKLALKEKKLDAELLKLKQAKKTVVSFS